MNFQRLQQVLSAARDSADLYQRIVDAPFEQRVEAAYMFLGIVVFLRVNKETDTIDRIALSDTGLAKKTLSVSAVPFHKIKIPLNARQNAIVRAIKSGLAQDTTDWRTLFIPVLKPKFARINQASAGIAYSAVHPLQTGEGGALIFSYFQYPQEINKLQLEFMEGYTRLVEKSLRLQPAAI